MAILEHIEAKAFLGEEFLTWLLWRSETRNGLIGVREHEVHFGGSLTLSAPFGDAEEVTLKGENPAGAHELHSALAEGKLIAKAQTRWVIEGVEWHAGLRGETLALSGVKPPLKSGPTDAAWLERRLELFDEFAAAIDGVFAAFLGVRLDDKAWKKETKAIREWVGESGQTPDPPELIEIREV